METDISKLHKGTDGFYYEDYIAPDKPETFVGKLVSTEWWRGTIRPDMQLSGSGRAEDCLIRLPEAYRFLRAERRCGQFQTCGEEYPLGV